VRLIHKFKILVVLVPVLTSTSNAHAYKVSFQDSHMGVSLGLGYAKQLPTFGGVWDPLRLFLDSSDTYTNPNDYKTPLRLGYFYRHSQFAVEGYLNYFTNYKTSWSVNGTNTGSGTTAYKGIGLGLDFEMPFYTGQVFRVGLLISGERLANKAVIKYTQDGTNTTTRVDTTSPTYLAGAGLFSEYYLGDLWSLALHANYIYNFGGTWSVSRSGSMLGNTYSKGDQFLDANGLPKEMNLQHWKLTALLRLKFY